MFQVLFLSIPPALIWVMLTGQMNLGGFVIGYLIGAGIVSLALKQTNLRFNPLTLPRQGIALVIYILVLLWDIWLSGIDVLYRIIGLRPVNPGIVRVDAQDEGEVIAALSAHGITITPGQLVVDFDEAQRAIYVHCLDVEASAPKVDAEQTRRLKYLRRFLG